MTVALHEPACHATSLTARAGIGSPDSCFSSTDLPELTQDTDRQRQPAENWASVRQVATVRMSQLLPCPPSANARDSRHSRPPGLAPQGVSQAPDPAPAPALGPPPCGEELCPSEKAGSCPPPQTLWVAGGWQATRSSAHVLYSAQPGGARSGVTGQGPGARLAVMGEHGAPGSGAGLGMSPQGGVYEASASFPGHARTWDGSHAACQGRNELTAEAPGQVLTDPAQPPSPQKTGSGQNDG